MTVKFVSGVDEAETDESWAFSDFSLIYDSESRVGKGDTEMVLMRHKATWSEAQAGCWAKGPEWDLVSITSAEQNAKALSELTGLGAVWIGLRKPSSTFWNAARVAHTTGFVGTYVCRFALEYLIIRRVFEPKIRVFLYVCFDNPPDIEESPPVCTLLGTRRRGATAPLGAVQSLVWCSAHTC